VFVLLAGLAGISAPRFTLAIAIGRGIRYFGEGLLALYYGDRAIAFLEQNSRTVGLWLVGLLVAGFVAYVAVSRTQRAKRL
jgi:membrane protein DedA with SNARE-associated domain